MKKTLGLILFKKCIKVYFQGLVAGFVLKYLNIEVNDYLIIKQFKVT